MKSLSNKYNVETIVPVQNETIRYFDVMIIAGQKLTIVFHADFQNWHWSCLPVTSCNISFLEMKRALWGVSTTAGPLCGKALLIFEPQHESSNIRYSLYLYLFSFSVTVSYFFMSILDGRTRGCFSKDEVYWSCNILYTAWKPNKIKVIFFNIVPSCALRNVN